MTEIEFRALTAQGYNRIPLMAECLADLDTPLSLYVKLIDRERRAHSFLLESVVGGERFGRYSFIGLPAHTWLQSRGQTIEVVRDGERGGTGADAGDAFAVFLHGDGREEPGDVAFMIGRNALQAADGDGFAVEAATAAGGLARPVARSPENAGEDVRLAVEHVGIGESALRDQPNIFGNVGVGRACPLAVHNLVKVIRIAGFCRVHSGVFGTAGG